MMPESRYNYRLQERSQPMAGFLSFYTGRDSVTTATGHKLMAVVEIKC